MRSGAVSLPSKARAISRLAMTTSDHAIAEASGGRRAPETSVRISAQATNQTASTPPFCCRNPQSICSVAVSAT